MAERKSWAFLLSEKNEDGTLKYPELPPDPNYYEVLERHREAYRGLDLESIAVKLNEFEAQKAKLEDQLAEVDSHITALERLMVSLFETSEIDKIRVGGFTFGTKVEPVVTKGDPVALVKWYQEHMPEKLSINHMSLLADVRLALTGEGELPEGVVVNTFTKITRRK